MTGPAPEELKKMFHVEHLDAIATDIQYEGHIERQKKQAEKSPGWKVKSFLPTLITNAFTP